MSQIFSLNKNNSSVKIFLNIFIFVCLFFFLFGWGASSASAAEKQPVEYSCSAAEYASRPLECLAQSILSLMAAFVGLCVSLFGWAADPNRMMDILKADTIYAAWKLVRDFLNIAFILFMLFSAFCTIFQVSKYSIKSTWLNLVLMALLVNFSFPIARFVIDVSNVLAYTMLSDLFPGGLTNYTSTFAQMTKLSSLVNPDNAGLVTLVFLNIFLFIFGVTFLVMALLFIIRVIALSVLIIFSVFVFLGFTGIAITRSKTPIKIITIIFSFFKMFFVLSLVTLKFFKNFMIQLPPQYFPCLHLMNLQ
jgi:MFS family permease